MTGAEKLGAIRATGAIGSWIDPRFLDEVDVRAGELIAAEGTPCNQLVVIVDGNLQSCAGGHATVLGRGDSIGWSAMERRGPNEATVVARSDARLLVMSHAQFRAAAAPPPKRRFARWALPSFRRSLPRPAILAGSVDAKKTGANPAC